MVGKSILLRATPEVRDALDNLGDEQNFINYSPIVIQHMSTSLHTTFSTFVKPSYDAGGIKENPENFSDDVKYIVRRLVFGLSSKRKFCRNGFYATLETLLHLYPDLLSLVFSVADKYYEEEVDKSPITDPVVGITLALGAIIQSGCVSHDAHKIKVIVKRLNILRTKTSYADPIVGQFIVSFLKDSRSEHVAVIWEEMRIQLVEAIETLPLSLVWIRVILCRSQLYKQLLDLPSGFLDETLGPQSYPILYSLFKSAFSNNVNINSIVEDYYLSLSLHCGEEQNLISFFNTLVVPGLENPTPQRLSLNFTLIELMIPFLSQVDHLKSLFCQSVVQQLLSAGSFKGDVAITSGRKVVAAILQKIILHKDKDDSVQITLLRQLINPPGTVRFDKVTGTKLFLQSYEYLKVYTIKELTAELFHIIENDKYEASTGIAGLFLFSGEVLMAAQWVSKLLTHPSVVGSDFTNWRGNQIAVLLKNIFFRKHPPKEFQTLKETFLRVLEQPTKKLEDQINLVEKIVLRTDKYIQKLKKRCTLSPKEKDCWRKVVKKMNLLQEERENQSQQHLTVFRLLYGEMNLHLFLNAGMAMEVIDELNQCYKRSMKKKGKESEPAWVEVVIDLLLSLLSKGDHYWRKIALTVFRNICHVMDPAALSLITDIINPERETEFLMESNQDSVDDSEDDNLEFEDNENYDSDEEESDSEDESDEEDERDFKLIKLREEMQILVGLPEEDVDMDSAPDAELKILDQKLGVLMKAYQSLRKSSKKRNKRKLAKDETSLMHFRTRVCDLLEGLILEAPSLKHCVGILCPLLLAINKYSKDELQKQLCLRLKSILSDMMKVRKFHSDIPPSPEFVANEIHRLFELSHKVSSSMSKEIGLCCTFLVRSGLHIDGQSGDGDSSKIVIDSFCVQLEMFFSKKDWTITEVAFGGTLALETGALAQVLKLLLKYTFDSATRFFRKQQATELLKILMKNYRSLIRMPSKAVRSAQKRMGSCIVQLFNSITGASQIKIVQIVSILDLLRILRMFHRQHPDYEHSFDWSGVSCCMEDFYRRIDLNSMKTLKKAYHALGQVLGLQLQRDMTTTKKGILKNLKTVPKERDKDIVVNETGNGKGEKKKKGEKRKRHMDDGQEIHEEKERKLKRKKIEKKLKKIRKIQERRASQPLHHLNGFESNYGAIQVDL